ncbi:MAG: hypothetical protein PHG25_01365 [Candidatus Pacebacteria bacterium]|nr:hypothetical protein [Candidatus Paceibacterota bacterium]
MATRAVIQRLGSQSTYRYGVDSYDSTKLGLGNLIYQQSGSGEAGYAGPVPTTVARPMEQTTTIASQFPWAMQWQNNAAGELDWIFLADLSTAAATRRINAYTFNRRSAVWNWQGFVTVTFPTATAYTIRGFRMAYDLEITGTVSVSGTAVSGTSTLFSTNKVCVGNRIGFGSTDPTQITTWYEISAIGSDTSITLTTTAGTIAGGTAYVIEDLRCIMATTNATATNGGLYVVKGLNFNAFSNVGGTVPAATTVDNIRACYWLADASTVTNTVSFGLAVSTRTSPTSHMVYVLDTLANPVVFKYNIRAALTLTAGKDTANGIQYKTGSGGVITGAPTQLNNGRMATTNHGPYSGQEALYFTTASRVYAALTSNITSGSTTWLSSGYVMTEVPPGGVNTFAASGAMGSIEFAAAIDKFIIATGATQRNYVTQFRTDAGQLDRIWGVNTFQLDLSNADATSTPIASQTGGAYSIWSEGGLCYVATMGTTSSTNRLYALPLSADWEYASITDSRLVLPAISTPEVSKFTQFFTQEVQVVGGATGKNLGLNTEPYRMYYRTAGITDDSGSWTLLDSTGTASIDGSTSIQLMIEFRTIGTLGLPARICATGVIYEDLGTDSHYQPSVTQSSAASKYFAWRFSTAFGGTVPTMRIRLYNAVTGGLLLDDTTTSSASGTWTKSTNDGSSYGAYDTSDKANETTYIRYTPTTLGDNIKVRALLTQN